MICVNSVSVSPSSVTLQIGQWYYSAKAIVCPTNADCKSVQNTNVATVNATSGYIYANAVGSTKIYATAVDGSGCSDYLTVTVSNTIPVTSVSLDRERVSLEKCDRTMLMATVFPNNATNKALCWTSSNPDVASVNGNGVVCALELGSAVITATATDGSGVSHSCTVTVTDDLLVTSIEIVPLNRPLMVGEAIFLEAIVEPYNATNSAIRWSSSNNDIVTVNPESGLIYAQSSGIATIYATSKDGSNKMSSCTIISSSGVDYYITIHATELIKPVVLTTYCNTWAHAVMKKCGVPYATEGCTKELKNIKMET